MLRPRSVLCLSALLCASVFAGDAKPFPRVQLIPQSIDSISFQLDGREVLRYHFDPDVQRPHFFPLIGPAGRPVTRITSPNDDGHRHHLSLWVGHQQVAGNNIWEIVKTGGRIVHEKLLKVVDGDRGELTHQSKWIDATGKELLKDERTWRYLPNFDTGEFFLDLELTLTPYDDTLTLGKTGMGFLGVRVAKTMSVKDGGGVITDSEGRVGEPAILAQRARWCDYSGPVAPGKDGAPPIVNGVTLFDHPQNPFHPVQWHVRADGWMGASFNRSEPLEIKKDAPLKLKYRVWIHDGNCVPDKTDTIWKDWSSK